MASEDTSAARNTSGPAGATAVIICTRGRPDIVKELVAQLAQQTRPPDHIFVVASSADDVRGLDATQERLTVRIGRMGSSLQRNDGLDLAGSRFAYIVFFDDDFVPSRFWLARMFELFESRPDVAGLTGLVLADGTTTAGIPLDEAKDLVRRQDARNTNGAAVEDRLPYGANMGCNMAFRFAAIDGVRFDERLPLYAWLEDADFRAQVERRGHIVKADGLWGVHLGHKPGRVRGVIFGYSQIANAVYLARKGTVPVSHLARLASKNLAANLVRSLWPEPFVDRRGRLWGNMIALSDLIRGRSTPERILDF